MVRQGFDPEVAKKYSAHQREAIHSFLEDLSVSPSKLSKNLRL
jgi:hypothetical protein